MKLEDLVSQSEMQGSAVVQYEAARRQLQQAQTGYTWLRRIARRETRTVILERARILRLEPSLTTPVAWVGEWPDHASSW